MLPKELTDIFEGYDEDDFNLYLTKADYSTDNFLIDFVVDIQDINDKGASSHKWTIETKGHRKNHLSFDYAPCIDINDDHPLLWEFTDTQCQLYFTGQCKDIPKLFYDLFLTHKNLFANYQSFPISFREEIPYHKPFKYANGLLTEGPKKLMELYGECLLKNGLNYNFIGERPAKYWDGKQFTLESGDLKILFLGDTYIIGREFFFVRHDDESR